ncbi:hypothetical protein HGRIS_003937 [Hohenbuehelia grisea]|uniref:P-loop containing nucleoside triphosphate hydrolase protein n=1 Tax=Hohenbuehelia grisea TaxID=104357 RepID=A0ABR3JIL6_9AGAR
MEDTARPPPGSAPQSLQTRGYQQEMLDESLRRNIVIALDTGSGKTHIAMLRMKFEQEREPVKISWFLAPTVTLCEQQYNVIRASVGGSVGLISGSQHPDQWKDPSLWRSVRETHRIMVSTPQVLLDAMRHGYISMGRDIGLIVFDEAHHAVDNHPYRRIMEEFYFGLPVREPEIDVHAAEVRPMILGLTASPIFGGNVLEAFRTLESNLDAVIRSSRTNREELGSHVYRPEFTHIMFAPPEYPFSSNAAALEWSLAQMNIDEDPRVVELRTQLPKLPIGSPERARIDQKLSITIKNKKTFAHKGMRDFSRAAADICRDVGAWAADWYVYHVVKRLEDIASNQHANMYLTWREEEKAYLSASLPATQNALAPPSYFPDDIVDDCSDKVRALVECLLLEKEKAEAHNEAYSGIIFVQRRDEVYALTTVLSHHPQTKDLFKIGCLVGSSENYQRHSFLDITRSFQTQTQTQVLADFSLGEKNLLVSTSVAEEGIDVQACGNVIRWDPPPNMVSWAQSRGRARRKRSTFVLMFEEGSEHREEVLKWEALERQMVTQYDVDRDVQITTVADDDDDVEEGGDVLHVPSTGAALTLHSAIGHLDHFCAVIPTASNTSYRPLYDIDPPDMPEGWHSFEVRHDVKPHPGPYGATVTLPRVLAQNLRVFTVPTIYKKKISALRHVAFKAYRALYQADLLNDHLLPLTSVIEPHLEDEVKTMLQDVEKRAGLANVAVQMNPWDPRYDVEEVGGISMNEGQQWWAAVITVEGLPALRIFTRRPLKAWAEEDCPILHRPGIVPTRVQLSTSTLVTDTSGLIDAARDYTRRTFWAVHGSRMNWEDLDFHYLFLPCEPRNDEVWDQRREWLSHLNALANRSKADAFFANAEKFGAQFGYPSDLTVVRAGFQFGKSYRFIRWTNEEPTEEQLTDLKERYQRDEYDPKYPLLAVQEPHPRTNFLRPLPWNPAQPPKVTGETLLDIRHSAVTLLSAHDIEYANILPSIIRSIATSATLNSLRETLFAGSPLQSIPTTILMTAITAPVAMDHINYQRLETLGDTVLKFVVGIQLLSKYRYWHEGYLTKQKDHIVSNVRLAKHAVAKKLYRWIIRDRMMGKKWHPSYFSTVMQPSSPTQEAEPSAVVVAKSETEESPKDTKKKKSPSEQFSTKVLADVVEALIGAAYLHGSFDLGVECARLFDLGVEWHTLPCCVETILDRVEPDDEGMPTQLANVEKMLGYTFKRKFLLIEALTHASYQGNARSVSYERMEFLGDSVLDMIVTHFLYHAPGKAYSPGHIHLRRSAMVNAHMLAYICLRTHLTVPVAMPRPVEGDIHLEVDSQSIHLYQCLLHSSHTVLDDQRMTFQRYEKHKDSIEGALFGGNIYPWASLLRLQAPKFLSDMIESLLGAVYLDSNGNLDAAREVVQKLGMMDILERLVRDGVDVLHPVSRVSLWAQKGDKEVSYRFEKDKGQVRCVVEVDGQATVEESAPDFGKASAQEVRFVAAESLIRMMHLRDVGVNYELLKKKQRKKRSKTTKGTEPKIGDSKSMDSPIVS